MSLLHILAEKPWLSPGLSPQARAQAERSGPWDRGVGLTVFLAVVTIIFVLLSSAYVMRMGGDGLAHGHGGNDWRAIGEPPLLWLNTGLLAASSLAFHLARRAARQGRSGAAQGAVLAGGLLGLAFLAGQLMLWRLLAACGAFASSAACVPPDAARGIGGGWAGNPASAFFTLICAFHALHILGGLAAWAMTGRRLLAGAGPEAAARAVQLCARYWDFMLLVWLALMGLFVST